MRERASSAPATCRRSGARSLTHAAWLDAFARDGCVRAGGLDACRCAVLPVEADPCQLTKVMRQVRVAAGSLVLLGALVARGIFVLPGFADAGPVFDRIRWTRAPAARLTLVPMARLPA
jgi:hypothetical protein